MADVDLFYLFLPFSDPKELIYAKVQKEILKGCVCPGQVYCVVYNWKIRTFKEDLPNTTMEHS